MAWSDCPITDVVDSLKSDTERGLGSDEAGKRLAEHGPIAPLTALMIL